MEFRSDHERIMLMTLRQYLILMSFATALCWIAFGFVIWNVDPYLGNALVFSFFYLSFFLALTGTLSLAIFAMYAYVSRRFIPLFRIVQKSFRDSLIISFFLSVLLYLQARDFVRWWSLLLLGLVSVGVFGYIATTDKKNLHHS